MAASSTNDDSPDWFATSGTRLVCSAVGAQPRLEIAGIAVDIDVIAKGRALQRHRPMQNFLNGAMKRTAGRMRERSSRSLRMNPGIKERLIRVYVAETRKHLLV